MKKIALLFLALIMALSFFGCSGNDPDVAHNEDSTAEETTKATDETTVIPDEPEIPEYVPLSQKLIDQIDGAKKEEARNNFDYSTTVGMVELADKYRKIWEEKADEYYKKLMEYEDPDLQDYFGYIYTTDDLHVFVTNMKESWEAYRDCQCENYNKVLYTIHGPGTMVGPLMAEYRYEMQMEWTLELVEICERFGIE